jgi:gliding motility-associated-like protein
MKIIIIILIAVNGIVAQNLYYHDCEKDYSHIHYYTGYGHPINGAVAYIQGEIGGTFQMILKPKECFRDVEIIIDFESYYIPDLIEIYEDGEKTFQTAWLGASDKGVEGQDFVRGYCEYKDGVLIKEESDDVPEDFHNGYLISNVFNYGLCRVSFMSQSEEIIIKVLANPKEYSAMSLYVHCNEAFNDPEIFYDTAFVCYEPIEEFEIVDDGDCNKVTFIDSIYQGNPAFNDTICILIGDQVEFRTEFPQLEWLYNYGLFTVNQTFDFEGVAVDEDGCEFIHYVHVIAVTGDVYFPNIFSPNGDGNNDLFYGVATVGTEVQNIHIYDRWGNKVFKGKEWDGGRCTEGVYVYIAEIFIKSTLETKKIHGNLTLVK